jgi:hypothetical protein
MANPFKPGHDPRRNLRGRGKGQINLTDLVRKIAAEPISPGDKRTYIDAIIRSTFKHAHDGDMRAVEIIMERGWGKAVLPIETTGNGPLVTIIQEAPRAT